MPTILLWLKYCIPEIRSLIYEKTLISLRLKRICALSLKIFSGVQFWRVGRERTNISMHGLVIMPPANLLRTCWIQVTVILAILLPHTHTDRHIHIHKSDSFGKRENIPAPSGIKWNLEWTHHQISKFTPNHCQSLAGGKKKPADIFRLKRIF